MAVPPHHLHFKGRMKVCHLGHFMSALLRSSPQTLRHQSHSILDIAESSCFHHECITTDNFFITYRVSTQRASGMNSSTDSKDKVFTCEWFGWVVLLGTATLTSPAVSFFFFLSFSASSLSLNYTSVRDSRTWGQKERVWLKQKANQRRSLTCFN